MHYITAKQALMPMGWQSDIQLGITPDGNIGYAGPIVHEAAQTVSLLLPAPVNLHSHSFQRAMAGLTEAQGPNKGDSFWTWRKLMYRFLEQLDPEQIEAIAALVFMEMLEAGYSAVAEFHYLHHAIGGNPYGNFSELSDRIVRAAETAGIGLTLLPVHYQYGGCDKRPLLGGQLRFHNNIDQFARIHEGASRAIANSNADYNIGAAPHSLRAVDDDGLRAAMQLCPTGPIHMHLAEQVAEVEEFEACYSARPTQWLLDNYNVDARFCLIHCTQMNADETLQLAKTDAVVGLCPLTESNLGDGIFNGTQYLEAEGKFGIGSDSNVHISLFEELKTLEYSQRLRDRSRAALASAHHSSGRVLYDGALKGGSQAANRKSGAITKGMLADLVGIERDNQWLLNREGDMVLDSLVFAGNGDKCITDVWSAGRHVVTKGSHIKRTEIVLNFTKAMADLRQDI